MDNFLVRGLKADGTEVFYTGRAGEGWVSTSRSDGFAYATIEVARNKATGFNRMMTVHGVRFIAVPAVQEVAL
jgi:hypothetical protein